MTCHYRLAIVECAAVGCGNFKDLATGCRNGNAVACGVPGDTKNASVAGAERCRIEAGTCIQRLRPELDATIARGGAQAWCRRALCDTDRMERCHRACVCLGRTCASPTFKDEQAAVSRADNNARADCR